MEVHEYQAKEILKKYCVPVPVGYVALSPEEAKKAAEKIGNGIYVVKAQVHAGGRGKAGGVKVVKTVQNVVKEAEKMLGMMLVTHQTGSSGKKVSRLYVEKGSSIEKEFYLSMLVDRASERVMLVVSSEGGMDIEEVATNTPDKILSFSVDPAAGISSFHGRKVAESLGFRGTTTKDCVKLVNNLYKAFISKDMGLLEINPLVQTKDGDLICLDAKMNFDDNALFAHPDIRELRDIAEENPMEIKASEFDLSYVHLSGSIACLVNGAGLAMATMDVIKSHGGEPANFLDVGGSASKEKVTEAFKIILSDSCVKSILVNIFGGIMRCDIIAEGIIAAAEELGLKVPLVVRLAGTNVDIGRDILAKSGLNIITAEDLDDAAQKAVTASA